MTITIKICGITNLSDAQEAIQAGADYLGLIFVPTSPRAISVPEARQLLSCLSHRPKIVGVFQNASPSEVAQVVSSLSLDLIQLHGSEKASEYSSIAPVIRVIQDLNTPWVPDSNVQFWLFDRSKTLPQENWFHQLTDFISKCADLSSFWIAGGLTPETVLESIMKIQHHPSFCGVDVASGVEVIPGQKDLNKMTAFCAAIRGER